MCIVLMKFRLRIVFLSKIGQNKTVVLFLLMKLTVFQWKIILLEKIGVIKVEECI